MLKLTIPAIEQFDEINQEFVTSKEVELVMEHSLVSLSKWESEWCKPFLTSEDKTEEETRAYIRCMTITQNVNPNVYKNMDYNTISKINEYIDRPMTATVISQRNSKRNSEIITAELIYYWMIALEIPFECQKWHLNRLLTLINVCSIKNTPPKKMGRQELMRRNTELNAKRRQALNSKG